MSARRHLPAVRACVVSIIAVLAGCAGSASDPLAGPPELIVRSPTTVELLKLPPPSRRLVVAVYDFPDLTGQRKPSSKFAEFSHAVTQGGAAMLIKALHDAGKRSWFQVIERNALDPLLQERRIIRQTREQFLGPDGQKMRPIGPLLNAGVVLAGGVVGYETNTLTGGIGARFLGIGGHTEYRRDSVTVELRTVSTQSGEVLTSVTTTKTIYSVALQGSAFRFISFEELLEAEAGVTRNEPAQLAVRQAIEKAVLATIFEGALQEYWSFADRANASLLLAQYVRERDGTVDPHKGSLLGANDKNTSGSGANHKNNMIVPTAGLVF